MLIWLGRLCERAGMQERAGELFARVTQTDPSNPDAWIWLDRWQVVEEEKKAAKKNVRKQNKPPAAKKVKLDRTLKPESRVATIFNLL